MNVITLGSGSLFAEQLRLRLSEEMLRLVRAQQDHDELQVEISHTVIDDLRHLAERNDWMFVPAPLAPGLPVNCSAA